MKLMYKGEVQTDVGILAALAGTRCDEVVLTARDVQQLARLAESEHANFVEWLNHLLCRFVPTAAVSK